MDEYPLYTPSEVWSVLTGASNDPNEAADVWSAWGQMPRDEATFLYALALGWPARRVMKTLGLKGNQTRLKRDALTRLTGIANGVDDLRGRTPGGSTLRRGKDG